MPRRFYRAVLQKIAATNQPKIKASPKAGHGERVDIASHDSRFRPSLCRGDQKAPISRRKIRYRQRRRVCHVIDHHASKIRWRIIAILTVT
jgi:hypothetical protein